MRTNQVIISRINSMSSESLRGFLMTPEGPREIKLRRAAVQALLIEAGRSNSAICHLVIRKRVPTIYPLSMNLPDLPRRGKRGRS